MAVLDVVEWPAQVLETKSEDITDFGPELQALVKNMHETMDHSGGIGLAANQVGVAKRLIVIHIPWLPSKSDDQEDEKREPWHDKRYTLINPKIKKHKGRVRWQEGCLSFPEIFEFVDRAEEVWIEAQDETGKTYELHATGLMAVCVQHEIDHIDGIVFIKRMSRLKSSLVRQKLARRGRQIPILEE